MVLLHVLQDLALGHGWRLTAAHLNHGLRGRASDADEALVCRAARRLGCACVTGRADVRALARRKGLSIEMAAREARHEFLAQTARRLGIRVILLAHHADDRVELFLLRLFRGAGLAGLAGMKRANPSPANARLRLARPFFELEKAALLEYAAAREIAFREDASNASLEIQRNRVRRELLPLLRRRYQPAIDATVLRAAGLIEDAGAFLSLEARRWLESRPGRPFRALSPALQREILRTELIRSGVAADYDLIERLRQTADRPFSIGPDRRVRRLRDGTLRVERSAPHAFQPGRVEVDLSARAGRVLFDGVELSWRRVSGAQARRLLRSSRLEGEVFDADRVGTRIVLRHWTPGDRFRPIGMPSAVKLQDWFTNRKVARAARRALTVAATAGGTLWWVENQRIGEEFKVTAAARNALRWQWRRRRRPDAAP